jgi:transcriptional regulator with XRE-family HTH domain
MTSAMPTEEEPLLTPEWTQGDRLRKSRETAGLTQEQIGELLADLNNGNAVKHSTVAAWERDRNQPRNFMAMIDRWSEITRVPKAWLLGIDSRSTSIHWPLVPVGDNQGSFDDIDWQLEWPRPELAAVS